MEWLRRNWWMTLGVLLAILAAFGAGRAMGSSRYGLCFALLVDAVEFRAAPPGS